MIPQIGIDVGKSALDVCRAGPGQPRRWPVERVKFSDTDWFSQLTALVPDGAVVVAEPTGWAYLQPIVTALRAVNCTLWLVPNRTAANIRRVHVSSGKSDKMDARALAVAAAWIAEGRTVLGAYIYSARREEATIKLRALVNEQHSLKKERTRAANRLDQLAHAIWPALNQHRGTWERAVAAGYVSPYELHELAQRLPAETVPGYEHGNSHRALERLIAKVPLWVEPSPETLRRLQQNFNDIQDHNARLAHLEVEIAATIREPTFAALTERWLTVPEASELAVACLHVATRGIADTFSRDEFKTAVGAAPRRSRSGSTDRATNQRPGYRPAMTAMHFWAMRLVSEKAAPNPVRDYYRRLEEQHHPYKFRAAVGKLARVLSGVARSGENFRYD